MAIYFQCESCSTRMRAADSRAGKVLRCPKCGGEVRVPQDESAGVPDAQEADPTLAAIKRIAAAIWQWTRVAAGAALAGGQAWRAQRAAAKAGAKAAAKAPPEPEVSVENLPEAEPVPEIPVAPETERLKPCQFCGEMIRVAAVKCRFCGEFVGHLPTDAYGLTLPGVGGTAPRPGAGPAQQRTEWKPPPYHDARTWPISVIKWFFVLALLLFIVMCAYNKTFPTSIAALKTMFIKTRGAVEEKLPEEMREKLGLVPTPTEADSEAELKSKTGSTRPGQGRRPETGTASATRPRLTPEAHGELFPDTRRTE